LRKAVKAEDFVMSSCEKAGASSNHARALFEDFSYSVATALSLLYNLVGGDFAGIKAKLKACELARLRGL
jgi:hypothetical protein